MDEDGDINAAAADDDDGSNCKKSHPELILPRRIHRQLHTFKKVHRVSSVNK